MKTSTISDKELLTVIVGVKATRQYKGRLTPLMLGEGDATPHPKLMAAVELTRRLMKEKLYNSQPITSSRIAREYLVAHFLGQPYESFVTLFLDKQLRILKIEELFRGTIDGQQIYPREVVRAALKYNAAACIFAHNHPSGLAEPSLDDQEATEQLKYALSLVDVRIVDHIVVGGDTTVSFAARGLL
jgi:DNA repair protein RadC